MSRDRAALSESESVVRYRLEAGEVDWEIAPGRTVRGYGFNGQVPGPILEAKQGVPLEIEFTNRLPEPTVIHWHGLRIPAAMDGTEVVQRPVQPGETFTYRFTPPDAGTFWYHPHANETEQLEKGLYGALIVRAADELAVGPFEKEGDVYGIDDLPFYRGTGKKGIQRFGTIRIAPRKPSTARIPTRLREITPLVTGTATVTRTVKLGFKVNLRRGFDFVIDGERHHRAEPVNVGDLQVWDVVNTTQIDHPFHLHGFFFEVLEIDGKKPSWRSLEDVINVPPKTTVRIAWYPDDRPGMWMYHCHILETTLPE
jgi:FtsP/CotA-like multicopper oxidase with cupredoxin domain